MSNLLRDIFDNNSEYNRTLLEQIRQIKQGMIDDHHCNYCKNCTKVPHVEMGRDAGTDPYCNIHMKLMLNYEDGSECIFWEYNGGDNL